MAPHLSSPSEEGSACKGCGFQSDCSRQGEIKLHSGWHFFCLMIPLIFSLSGAFLLSEHPLLWQILGILGSFVTGSVISWIFYHLVAQPPSH